MQDKDILKFLKCLGVENGSANKRGGWVVAYCPLGPWNHDNGKSNPEAFGIKKGSGDLFCNCMSCGYHGSQSDLVLELKLQNKKAPSGDTYQFGEALQLIANAEENQELNLESPSLEDEFFAPKTGPEPFPEWWLDTFPKWSASELAIEYLNTRQITDREADQMDIRFDPQQKRVCFPVRDFAGQLMGLHGRAIEDNTDPRYRMYTFAKRNNPLVWLGEHTVDLNRPILVVEGPFDKASVLRVYDNVVTPLFANPSFEKLRRMSDALEWHTLLDVGKGGDKGRERIDQALGDHVIYHHLMPDGVKDPGNMGLDDLRTILGDHLHLRPT